MIGRPLDMQGHRVTLQFDLMSDGEPFTTQGLTEAVRAAAIAHFGPGFGVSKVALEMHQLPTPNDFKAKNG